MSRFLGSGWDRDSVGIPIPKSRVIGTLVVIPKFDIYFIRDNPGPVLGAVQKITFGKGGGECPENSDASVKNWVA
jgi:hypothetical protein